MNRSHYRGRKLARVLLIFSMIAVLTLIALGAASLF